MSWTAVAGANHYDVWINDLTTGQSQVVRVPHVTSTSVVVSLAGGATYEVWVRALGDTGASGQWSTGVVFSVTAFPAPTLFGPSGQIGTLAPTFSWSTVAGASQYELWVNDVTTGQSQVIHTTIAGATFVSSTTLTSGDTYEWWARAFDSAGNPGVWSAGIEFSAAAVGTPTLLGPLHFTNPRATFSWSAVSGADHYQLWINDVTTGQSAVVNQTVPGTSFTVSLQAGDTYVWWVRAFNASGAAGFWSSAATVTAVSFPVPLSPIGNVASSNGMVTFSWSGVNDANHYDLWVDDVTTGQSQVVRAPVVRATTYVTTTPLTVGDTYEWWVRAQGAGSISGKWSVPAFFTLVAVDAPTLIAPSGSISAQMPTFTWSSVAGADHYEIWVNDDTTGQAKVIWNNHVATTSFVSGTSLNAGDTFTWWVRALTSANMAGIWSAPVTFSLAPLDRPEPISPMGQQTNPEPTFSWTAIAGTNHYDLWVDDLTTGESQILRAPVVRATSFVATSPLPLGDTFEWWVRAEGAGSVSGKWSLPATFTLAALPAPTLIGPSGGITNRLPTFTWNAVSGAAQYELWLTDETTGQVVIDQDVSGTSFADTIALMAGDDFRWWVRGITSSGADSFWSNPLEFVEA